jgi:competence protein ComEA
VPGMRSRRPSSDESVADVTRRRLDALIAELAASRGETPAAAVADAVAEPERPSPQGAAPSDRPAPPSPGRHARRPLQPRRRLAGWVDDRLPASMQGRAHLGSAQFGLVALVVAVGLVAGAWWLVRAGGSSGGAGELAPPRPAVSSAGASTSGSPPSPATAAPPSTAGEPEVAGGEIVVDVVGKVRRPGIAVLPVGSRVVDAVQAAGGMRPGVDPATVNLARPLADGEQVVIGIPSQPAALPGAPAPTGSPPTGGGLVNLNTADQATLETLPGVGPVTAAAILQWRTEHGGFTSVEELLEVSGIGDATLAEIAPHVTL